MEENSILTRALLFVLLFLAVGVSSSAYAEEELTVTVQKYTETIPVEIEHPVSNWFCEKQSGGFVPVTTCVFQGVTEDGSTPVYDIEKEKWTTREILEKEMDYS